MQDVALVMIGNAILAQEMNMAAREGTVIQMCNPISFINHQVNIARTPVWPREGRSGRRQVSRRGREPGGRELVLVVPTTQVN